MSEFYAAWLAGFFEGEGCFSMSGGINWSISQSGARGKQILAEIQSYLAGHGLVTQLKRQNQGKYKPCYQLRIRNKAAAQGLLKIIAPHMKFRLTEALAPAEMVGEKGDAGRAWTAEEDEILRAGYATQGREQLAAWLGRTVSGIQGRARYLGLLKIRKWTAEDERWMLEHWATPLAEQAVALNRTKQSINLKRASLRKHGRIPQAGLYGDEGEGAR